MDTFQEKVRQQEEKLTNQSCFEIESSVARKRIQWCRDYFSHQPKITHPTPRDAYELLFFEYMGLTKTDLPVISETATEITWSSQNPCPTLDACIRLGLDTRKICRAAYEKSTQAFISQIDPQLRFKRSYTEIRPYSPFCRESIQRVDFNAMMQIAIEEAKISRQEGNKGYGAVVVFGDQILAQAHDTAVVEKDPVLHAEVNAIHQAIRVTQDPNLSGAILFCSCEPCPMCSALAVWANITTIVYGASIEDTVRLGKARIRVGAAEIVEKSPVNMEVIGGILKEECLDLYQ